MQLCHLSRNSFNQHRIKTMGIITEIMSCVVFIKLFRTVSMPQFAEKVKFPFAKVVR